ncbi:MULTISPECIES: DUF6236 family protein [Paraburkholderia]|uniref:Uncharacterized protein n=1 Tax=Paraburkholderia fynbosensis TaxID=1200993 RepID=A0A6J5GG74_9BURK|nr:MULTISPECIES: DUF6236 family protein [Paraburkholderia]MBC8730242.1 hypothetical protein [Paraburkholderia sp. UCT2]CAB3799993.1 hypothetical protein LMG27177_04707 [Paraburkholderia fynbosensis]
MRNNALYFPYVSIPDTAWTMRTLLYWDKVSAIVPLELAYRPEELDVFMRELLDVGLVNTVIPAQYLWRLEQFDTAFVKLVEARLRTFHYSPEKIKARPRVRIHIEKLQGIPEFLVRSGAAERLDDSWYMVEASIAKLFMAYLAVCLGGLEEVDAAPVTNRWEYTSLLGLGRTQRRPQRPAHQDARHEILDCLLPVPEGEVNLAAIVKFKEQYGDLLPALRRVIEVRSAEIALLQDAEDRADAISDFVKQSKLQIDELSDAMRFNWKKLTFGALFPLAANGIQWATTSPDSPALWAGTALSFASAAYTALTSPGENSASLRKEPLAYIAHAHRRFATKRD